MDVKYLSWVSAMVIIGAGPFTPPKSYDKCRDVIFALEGSVFQGSAVCEHSVTKERFFVLSDKVAPSCMWLLRGNLG